MKVILLQDVKSLGKKGEIVEVSDGYARNYVLPKKLGAEANSKNMNDLKLQKANEEKVAKQQLEAAQETFGSISSKEIAEEAKKQCDLALDKKKIQLPEAIKSLGVYEVHVKLHTKVTGRLKVKVVEE